MFQYIFQPPTPTRNNIRRWSGSGSGWERRSKANQQPYSCDSNSTELNRMDGWWSGGGEQKRFDSNPHILLVIGESPLQYAYFYLNWFPHVSFNFISIGPVMSAMDGAVDGWDSLKPPEAEQLLAYFRMVGGMQDWLTRWTTEPSW